MKQGVVKDFIDKDSLWAHAHLGISCIICQFEELGFSFKKD